MVGLRTLRRAHSLDSLRRTILNIAGNHEHNAPWKHEVRKLLSNATHFLCDESCVIECPSQGGVVSEAADSGVMVSGGDGGGPRRPSQDSVVSEPADSGVMASGGDDGGPQRTLKIHGTNFFWPMTTPNPVRGARTASAILRSRDGWTRPPYHPNRSTMAP
mmetsp:Transcript_27166/g.47402  ORF Transcript_27166/g.47402 Transcript_27166/m.47402 type:complete len:161 (+) Transcript_27166:386-868(+)